jgi:hypothetical protein
MPGAGSGVLQLTREAVGKPARGIGLVADAGHPPHCQDVQETSVQKELTV